MCHATTTRAGFFLTVPAHPRIPHSAHSSRILLLASPLACLPCRTRPLWLLHFWLLALLLCCARTGERASRRISALIPGTRTPSRTTHLSAPLQCCSKRFRPPAFGTLSSPAKQSPREPLGFLLAPAAAPPVFRAKVGRPKPLGLLLAIRAPVSAEIMTKIQNGRHLGLGTSIGGSRPDSSIKRPQCTTSAIQCNSTVHACRGNTATSHMHMATLGIAAPNAKKKKATPPRRLTTE
eukprot:scaffold7909_cov36-Tisochrysis_lutea.AAC.4